MKQWSNLKKLIWMRFVSAVREYSGAIVTFFTSVAKPLQNLIIHLQPIQTGSGTPSPDNVRPISGRTGANAFRVGKNLLDPDIVVYQQYLSTTGWRYSSDSASIAIPVKPNTEYTLSRYLTTQSIYRLSTIRVDTLPDVSDTSLIDIYQSERYSSASGFGTSHTKTTDEYATYLVIQFSSDTTLDFIENGQVEVGPTATDYEPYQGTTYPVAFGDTVYAGLVDVVSGVLKSRPYYPSYNGKTLVGPWVSSMDEYSPGATPTIGAQVVDLGGVETETQLTPQEVLTLVGTNNVWSDSGDVTVRL